MSHTITLHGSERIQADVDSARIRGDVTTYQADLSSPGETTKLAQAIKANREQIAALVNDAGIYKAPDPILPNGLDARFVVNTLARRFRPRRFRQAFEAMAGSSTCHLLLWARLIYLPWPDTSSWMTRESVPRTNAISPYGQFVLRDASRRTDLDRRQS